MAQESHAIGEEKTENIPDGIMAALKLYDGVEISRAKELDTGNFWLMVEGHAYLSLRKLDGWELYTSTNHTSGKVDWTFKKVE